MSSYLRQTNYEPLRVPLYQPDFGLISRVSLMQQSRYDRGVQSIANTYNESLGLSQNLSPYNQQKLNGYMDNATQQLKKMSTLDFSKANNVAQASNLFSPIYQDKSLMFEHQAHTFGEEQLQTGAAMRTSKDKDVRDGYSDINMEYVNNPLSKLSGAKSEEEVYKNGSEVMNRYYLPYQNTVAKLDKAAKDAGLDYSVSYVNGAYIVTNKFGAPAYPSMKEFAQMNIDANDIKQLEINSTVGIERMQRDLESKGIPVTNEAIAGNIMENYRGNLNDGIQQQQKVVNALQARFNQLEGMKQNGALNDVGDNSPYKQYIQLGQQLDEAKKGLSDSQDEYKKYSDPSSDEYRKMYGDYVANPVDGAFKMAYGNLTDGWAKTWADGHVDSSLKMDDVWAKTQDILMRQLELSLKDTKDAKKPEPTEAEKKLAIANTPVPLGQSPDFNSSSVLSGTMYNVINKAEQNSKDLIKEHSYDYMDYMVQKNWNIYTPGTGKHTWLVENVAKRVTDPNKINAPIDNDVRDELSKSPMFKGVDLTKMSYLDLYKRLANESGQYVQHGFDIGDPDANALISGKHSMAVEQANIDHIEQLRKNPESILSQMDKYKDFQGDDGYVIKKDMYVKRKLKEAGYTLKDEALPSTGTTLGLHGGQAVQSTGTRTYRNGKQVDYPKDLDAKYNAEYDQQVGKFNDLEQSLKKDPAMVKLAFEANYPSYGFDARKDVDNETGEKIFNQVFSEENLSNGLTSIRNLDQLTKASGLSAEDVTNMVKEFRNEAKSDYRVQVVDYSPDGKTPYKFIFGQAAIDDFASKDKESKSGAMAFKDKYQDLAAAIKQNGIEIAYGGKTSADTYRENSLERAVNVLGNYSFDIDSQGKFGYSIRRINKGDNVNEITLHYKSAVDPSTNQYSRNPDGSFQFQDRKQTIEVGAMTPDEAGNMALTTLIELNGRYQNDLNQKR